MADRRAQDRRFNMSEAVDPLTIAALGAHGDGIATGADGETVFVPYALPGERWHLDGETGEASLVTPAADRAEARCPHYTRCGGCIAQHMPDALYRDWKRGLVTNALSRAGLEVAVAPLLESPAASRRRAALTAKRTLRGIALGFHARASHDVVDIEHCAILHPAIADRLDALRAIALHLAFKKDPLRLLVVATRGGLSVDISGTSEQPDAEARAALADIAQSGGIVRLVVDGRDVVEFTAPEIDVDGVAVRLPDRVFLQATEAAEAEMTRLVTEACGRAKRVADLFCGIGTFALALSRSARVSAFDNAPDAISALTNAHRNATHRKPVTAQVRDLFREPLSRRELADFDAVVFDPPRAGAKDQATSLAKSDVPVVVGVSCNPATFARDAAILVDGGYTLEQVTPIDQFVFSEHVEVVGVFRKPPRRKRLGQRR
jgi:23S rRNA (uracil1939-C5)-methyltransferase